MSTESPSNKPTSWTKRLSLRLKKNKTAHQNNLDTLPKERPQTSENEFGRSRGIISKGKEPETTQQAPPAPETERRSRSRASSFFRGRRTSTASNQAEYLEDDIIGLDQRGRARRSSSLASVRTNGSRNPFSRRYVSRGSSRPGSSHAQNVVPTQPVQPMYARDYVAPPQGQLLRKSRDDERRGRKSQESSLLGSLNPFKKNQESTKGSSISGQPPASPTATQTTDYTRKELPPIPTGLLSKSAAGPASSSKMISKSTGNSDPAGGDLPIYRQFHGKEASKPSTAMDNARGILDREPLASNSIQSRITAPNYSRKEASNPSASNSTRGTSGQERVASSSAQTQTTVPGSPQAFSPHAALNNTRDTLGNKPVASSSTQMRTPALNTKAVLNSSSALNGTRGRLENNFEASSPTQKRSTALGSREASSPSPVTNGRGILNQALPASSSATRQTRALDTNVSKSTVQSTDNVSPVSFLSARDDFPTTKDTQYCDDVKDQQHPTQQQVVERAQYNSAETTVHERMAPAVTHEVVQKKVHVIDKEELTRDIHHYHHIHRLLPVHDVEILPAKHYRVVNGVQVEMKQEEVAQSRLDAWEAAIVPKRAA